jgi:hypothetical protein
LEPHNWNDILQIREFLNMMCSRYLYQTKNPMCRQSIATFFQSIWVSC